MTVADAAPQASREETFFTAGLAEADPELAASLQGELRRQPDQIQLIASANSVYICPTLNGAPAGKPAGT